MKSCSPWKATINIFLQISLQERSQIRRLVTIPAAITVNVSLPFPCHALITSISKLEETRLSQLIYKIEHEDGRIMELNGRISGRVLRSAFGPTRLALWRARAIIHSEEGQDLHSGSSGQPKVSIGFLSACDSLWRVDIHNWLACIHTVLSKTNN